VLHKIADCQVPVSFLIASYRQHSAMTGEYSVCVMRSVLSNQVRILCTSGLFWLLLAKL
jgi:hypothetical protein